VNTLKFRELHPETYWAPVKIGVGYVLLEARNSAAKAVSDSMKLSPKALSSAIER
jgi:hypothetical protein